MKRTLTIITALLIGLSSYGQMSVNKRIMLDSLNNKIAVKDTSSMLANYALTSEVSVEGASIGDVRDEIADTSFNNNDIPPGYWVWGTISGASKDNKPTMLVLTMTGFKRNRSY